MRYQHGGRAQYTRAIDVQLLATRSIAHKLAQDHGEAFLFKSLHGKPATVFPSTNEADLTQKLKMLGNMRCYRDKQTQLLGVQLEMFWKRPDEPLRGVDDHTDVILRRNRGNYYLRPMTRAEMLRGFRWDTDNREDNRFIWTCDVLDTFNYAFERWRCNSAPQLVEHFKTHYADIQCPI